MGQFNIQVVSMKMAVDNGYQDQYSRPYETVATGDTVNLIRERVDMAVGSARSINAGVLAGVAGDFVMPQAHAESQINIANGWGMKRFYFFLEVRIFDQLGGYTTELIQGYTDHADTSYTGRPDPHTRCIINSVTKMSNVRQQSRLGGQMENHSRVTDAFHVVANNQWESIDTLNNPQISMYQSMRPGDLYKHINAANHLGESGSYIDLNTTITNQPRASRRSNGMATDYTGRVINGYVSAMSSSMFETAGAELYASAAGHVLEQGLARDPFIMAISQANNHPISNAFTLQDLYRMDPQLLQESDNRMAVFTGGTPLLTAQAIDPMQAEFWHGANKETQAATIISNGIPSLMIDGGFSVVHFLVTNLAQGGPVFQWITAKGLAGQEVKPFIVGFQSRLLHEILDQISYHNQIGYNIEIRAELIHSTMISIQLDSHPEVVFVSPTFADALMTPVVTTNNQRLAEVAGDFDSMLENVVQTPTPSLNSLDGFGNI